MKVSELIKELQDILNNYGDTETYDFRKCSDIMKI